MDVFFVPKEGKGACQSIRALFAQTFLDLQYIRGSSHCKGVITSEHAFQKSTQRTRVRWVHKDDLATNVSLFPNALYVCEEFNGEEFRFLLANFCWICGVECVKEKLLRKPALKLFVPSFNNLMDGVVISFTNVDKADQRKLQEKVLLMNGTVSKDFRSPVTHLVGNKVGGEKYFMAVNRGLPVMKTSWIEELWKESLAGPYEGRQQMTDMLTTTESLPFFYGLVIYISPAVNSRCGETYARMISTHGGIVADTCSDIHITHAILEKDLSIKENFLSTTVVFVKSRWLLDSIKNNRCMRWESYMDCPVDSMDNPNYEAVSPTESPQSQKGTSGFISPAIRRRSALKRSYSDCSSATSTPKKPIKSANFDLSPIKDVAAAPQPSYSRSEPPRPPARNGANKHVFGSPELVIGSPSNATGSPRKRKGPLCQRSVTTELPTNATASIGHPLNQLVKRVLAYSGKTLSSSHSPNKDGKLSLVPKSALIVAKDQSALQQGKGGVVWAGQRTNFTILGGKNGVPVIRSSLFSPNGKDINSFPNSQFINLDWKGRRMFMHSFMKGQGNSNMLEVEAQMKKDIRTLGGDFIPGSSYDDSCTHLICSHPYKTEKFFLACTAGKWILHPQYIVDSRKAGRFLSEESYEWGNPKAGHLMKDLHDWDLKMATAAHKWRLRVDSSGPGAFHNWKVTLSSDLRHLDSHKRWLEAGGGSVVSHEEFYQILTDNKSDRRLIWAIHDYGQDQADKLENFRKLFPGLVQHRDFLERTLLEAVLFDKPLLEVRSSSYKASSSRDKLPRRHTTMSMHPHKRHLQSPELPAVSKHMKTAAHFQSQR